MKKLIIIPLLTGLALGSCSKKKSSDDAADEVANPNVDAASVADLNLAGALDIDVGDSIAGSGSSLRLAGQKSEEACRLRQSTKMAVSQLSSVKNFFCHIEKESDSIPFNKRTLVKITGGSEEEGGGGGSGPEGGEGEGSDGSPSLASSDQYIGIFIDTTDAEATKVYMCDGSSEDDLALTEVFEITGTSGGKAKGIVFMSHDDGSTQFSSSIGFDANYTDEDIFVMAMKMKFEMSGGDGFSQYTNILINPVGVSTVSSSEKGTSGGNAMENAVASAFNKDYGQLVFSLNSEYNGQTFTKSTRACVDNSGVLVDCSSDEVFSGDINVKSSEVPGQLPDDFTPDAPTGFNCKGWEGDTVVIDMADTATAAAHDSCSDSREMFESENCWSSEYRASERTEEIKEDRGEIAPEPESADARPRRK